MRTLFYLFSVLALAAQPQTPDARALLIRSGGPAMMADTVRLKGTEATELNRAEVHRSTEDTFTLERSTGGRMRIEGKVGDVTVLQIADGSSNWTYVSSTKVYVQAAMPHGPTADGFGRIKFARDPAGFSDARVEREESLEFGGKTVPCYVVRASYAAMPANPSARDVVRTVWIAQSGELILRDSWEFSVGPAAPAPARSHITTNYSLIEWAIPLADDHFVFHPPEGSHAYAGSPQAAPVPAIPEATPPKPAVKPAVVLRRVEPEYSPEARAAGYQGAVSLYVEVDLAGKPATVHVMQGLGLGLDEKAVAAVKQWEFQPNAKPLAGAPELQDAREIQVEFHLDPPAPWSVSSEAYTFSLPEKERYGEVVKPSPTRYAAPDPAACIAAGTASVELLIDKDGAPQSVRAVEGAEGPLAAAAVKALQSWQFRPLFASGNPFEAHAAVAFSCSPAGTPAVSEAPPPLYRVGGGVSAPVLLYKMEPDYSPEARQAKHQGASVLYVRISPTGAATELHVVRMLGKGLDEKAMEAVKRWKFKPGMKDGRPVGVEATIEVNFRLL
jgi:TonB family protein